MKPPAFHFKNEIELVNTDTDAIDPYRKKDFFKRIDFFKNSDDFSVKCEEFQYAGKDIKVFNDIKN